MRELNVNEIEQVNGGDGADVAMGAISGGGIAAAGVAAANLAATAGMVAAVSNPVGVTVVVIGLIAGAIYGAFE